MSFIDFCLIIIIIGICFTLDKHQEKIDDFIVKIEILEKKQCAKSETEKADAAWAMREKLQPNKSEDGK